MNRHWFSTALDRARRPWWRHWKPDPRGNLPEGWRVYDGRKAEPEDAPSQSWKGKSAAFGRCRAVTAAASVAVA